MTLEEQELQKLAEAGLIGEQARDFIESEAGKAILGRAEDQAREAQIALGEVDPTDTKAIVALQRKIQCANWFYDWLSELVSNGEQAIAMFEQLNRSEDA